jgi:hypothetical protein
MGFQPTKSEPIVHEPGVTWKAGALVCEVDSLKAAGFYMTNMLPL